LQNEEREKMDGLTAVKKKVRTEFPC
jgi:hypothetical protein